jgi:hypothetical protein
MSYDAAQLKATGIYASELPLPALIGEINQVEQTCLRWKASRTRMRWIAVGLIVAGVFSAILLNEFTVMLLFGIVAAISGIALIVFAQKNARAALAHVERCASARALVEALRDDTHPKSPVKVKLLLNNDRNLLNQYDWTARKKGKQSFYEADWLTVENSFLDGTTVTESVTDLVRERSYVNPRGKWKKKIRTRHLVSLRLRYPAELYGDASASPEQLQSAVKTPSTAMVRSVQVSPADIKLKATVNSTPDLTRTCTMLLLGAYRILNFSRKVTSRRQAGGGVR